MVSCRVSHEQHVIYPMHSFNGELCVDKSRNSEIISQSFYPIAVNPVTSMFLTIVGDIIIIATNNDVSNITVTHVISDFSGKSSIIDFS